VAETISLDRPPVLQTVETRWFGPGSVPDDILNWFESLPGKAEDQPARRDFYLQSILDDGLSVKLREGGLEVKQRREGFGQIHFSSSVSGLVERWIKWRFPLDDSSSPAQSIVTGDSSWIAVAKLRRLKHYEVNETGSAPTMPLPTGAAGRSKDAPLAFHLELAQVWAGKSHWWTVGYEAGNAGENLLELLRAAAEPQFRENAPGQLTGRNSFGYPRWLVGLLE
jgi:hypothetical protein